MARLGMTATKSGRQPYRLEDVIVKTYDGRELHVGIEGIFDLSRFRMEELIIKEFAKIIKADIPTNVSFRRVMI